MGLGRMGGALVLVYIYQYTAVIIICYTLLHILSCIKERGGENKKKKYFSRGRSFWLFRMYLYIPSK